MSPLFSDSSADMGAWQVEPTLHERVADWLVRNLGVVVISTLFGACLIFAVVAS